jgi:hypothetical protein
MKHAIVRSRKQPIAWGDFEYAARHDHCADGLEARISERNLDSEDERMAVEVILHEIIHGVS